MSALLTRPVDPPESLPIAHLSVSSMNLFRRCPEAFKRKYIDHEPQRASGRMILGGAAGAALAQNFGAQMETGEALSTEQLLDEFTSEYEDRSGREEVDWGTDTPGQLKDSACAALRAYHELIAPGIVPVSVEREFALSWPGLCVDVVGYRDLETADGVVVDFKMTARRMAAAAADADLQPLVYLAANRAEGSPATFEFHTLVRSAKPTAEIVPTARTEHQLDLLTSQVFSIARAIEWRWRESCWSGVPSDLAWLCRGCSAGDCDWRLG